MNTARITQALRTVSDTASVTIGSGVLASAGALFNQTFGQRPAVVVADENTFAAAGRAVHAALAAALGTVETPYIFPGPPVLHADFEQVLALEAALRAHDALPVAVGAGTVNDIAKLAAHRCGRPYMVVATAASMDGYTAFGASITKDSYKQTMACPAPRAVLADTQVLVNAPARMTASGYADLLGKVTAGADWLVADALGVEPLHPAAWALIQDALRAWIARPAALAAGDESAMSDLIEGLIMAGLAMQMAQSSRPASGGEHLFSHLWEMEGLGQAQVPPLSHGFKVGVGSIACAALYEQVLARDLGALPIAALAAAWPDRAALEAEVARAHTVPGLRAAAVAESLAKYVDGAQLTARLTDLQARWPALRARLAGQLLPAAQLREWLQAAGCPVSPDAIGLSGAAFKDTYRRARQIRRRYTVLDLAAETGVLTASVDALFAPAGFWGQGA
ncbi:MAG: sn-glycerol-1-phosphate dehydrogenase [Anaerolineales bacterium]|nr:sn-glycerol-1-phosphate dehydrogenase [Anaerolineales bacterium]